MKIVKLEIEDDSLLSGVDAVALVETPAHEADFFAFGKEKFESYTDYPESAVNAAKRALEWRDSHPDNDCGTPVGWARANQLAKREPVSEETIARMASFARHLQYEDVPYSEGCGGLMVSAWGGRAGIEWASRKLEEIRGEFYIDPYVGVPSGLTDWLNEGPPSIKIIYAAEGNIDVYGYRTQHFEICPGAIGTFEHLKEMNPDAETIGMIRSAAVVADRVFFLEKQAIANEKASPEDLIEAIALVDDFKDIMHEIDEEVGMAHDVSYMDGHIEIITQYVDEEEMSNCMREMAEAHYFEGWPQDIQDRIIESLADSGETVADYADWDQISEEEFKKQLFAIVSSPNKESILDVGDIRIRYRYTGPRDSRNRKFCARVMSLTDQGKIFRKEDINQLTIQGENEQFGTYDIFTYKGSYNCRHSWEALYFRRTNGEGVKNGDKPAAIGDLLSSGVNKPVIASPTKGIQDKLNFARQALAEEQKVVGPLMRANKLILRLDENNEPYYVYFSPNTIKRISEKFMKEGRLGSFNLEHDSNLPLSDVYITEAWIVEDPETDKSAMYGFKANKGDWYAITKVADRALWNEFVKTGRVKGYSVEGFFMDQMFKQKEEKFVEPSIGESESDFMQRCMPVVVSEGYDPDQAAAICIAYYKDR